MKFLLFVNRNRSWFSFALVLASIVPHLGATAIYYDYGQDSGGGATGGGISTAQYLAAIAAACVFWLVAPLFS